MKKILKPITSLSEVAEALNFNLYPVIRMDVTKTDRYGIAAIPVRVATGNRNHVNGLPEVQRLKLQIFSDSKIPTVQEVVHTVSANCGYYDCTEMAEYATSPIIDCKTSSAPFILILDNPETRQIAILKLNCAKAPLTNCYYIDEFKFADCAAATAEFAQILENVNAYNKLADICKRNYMN